MANQTLGQFKARLARIPVSLRREIMRTIETQADGIANQMRAKAPVGDTGNLRRSIRTEKGDLRVSILAGGDTTQKESGGVLRSFVQGVRDGLRGRAARKAAKSGAYDYAFANEFGTQKMKAQPFFYPTFRSKRAGARKAIREAVKRAINER